MLLYITIFFNQVLCAVGVLILVVLQALDAAIAEAAVVAQLITV